MKKVLILISLILLIFNNCSNKNENNFISEFNYLIKLPENWNEYESDENNTNAFFDTTNWTGNLRITSMNYKVENSLNFLNKIQIEKKAKKISWSNLQGIYYVENKNNEQIHYWYLIEKNKLYVCSFLIGKLNGKTAIENELNKVENILKTIKTK